MIRKKKDLTLNYTDSDLQSFAILGNFNNYKVNSDELKNKKNTIQSVRYKLSDKKKFNHLMSTYTNTRTSSKIYSVNNFSNNDSVSNTKNPKYSDSFYKSLDLQNFNKLKRFPLSSGSDFLKNENKKEDSSDANINYTVSDLGAFDRITESSENSTNNQTAAKNDDAQDLKSKINRSSIKIMDFDKLKKREKIQNKQRIEKIKVVYFD